MELHIQKCQNCGSKHLKNVLVRKSGEPDQVIVQCHRCEELVATYVIAPMGYYHHGKGFESFLRGFARSGEFMSGRKVQRIFEARKEEALSLFKKVFEVLKNRNNKP